jgi:hypothetical protein
MNLKRKFRFARTDLHAEYLLDNSLLDSSGNGYDLVNYGATNTINRFAQPDKAAQFNGTSQYMATTDDVFDFTDDFTISCWALLDNIAAGLQAVCWKTNRYGIGFNALLTNTKFGVHCQSDLNVFNSVYAINTVTAGVWYNLVFTFLNSTKQISLYIDGVLQGTTTLGGTGFRVFPAKLHLGNYDASPDAGYFPGKIDDVRFFNRALSVYEIKGLNLEKQ